MTSHPQVPAPFEPIPQLDLAAQYATIGAEIRTAVEHVMASQQFILGREGAALEVEIAKLCSKTHGFVMAFGADALILALRARVCQAGDGVLLPPFTLVTTRSAGSAAATKPLFSHCRLAT